MSSSRAYTLREMARLTEHGLRRVLGTSALFSTAYGNVGSSIYYALGLVASFALGLTPVVFVVTGVIFYLTAATARLIAFSWASMPEPASTAEAAFASIAASRSRAVATRALVSASAAR